MAGGVTVYVDIVGDLFHLGHVQFLKSARALGSRLVVGVCSDETVASYKRTPVLSLAERVEVIEACRYVDAVVPDCPCPITREFIELHGIDIVAHGDDFDDDSIRYWYGVPIEMGIFRTVRYTEGISTSQIMDRIARRGMITSA